MEEQFSSKLHSALNRQFRPYSNNVFLSENIVIGENGYEVTKYVRDYSDDSVKPLKRCFKIDELSFNRFFSFSRFFQGVEEKKFVFISPTKWEDPFEKINLLRDDIYCICSTYDKSENEEALWKAYNDTSDEDKTVRISFGFEKMLDAFGKYEKEYDFYISPMDYYFSRDEILKISKYIKQIPNLSLVNQINALCLKRKAFSYENEIRILVVKKGMEKSSEGNGHCHLKNFDYQSGIISNVTLPPLSPFSEGDSREKLYPQLQFISNYSYYLYFNTFMDSKKIAQSHLYELSGNTFKAMKKRLKI